MQEYYSVLHKPVTVDMAIRHYVRYQQATEVHTTGRIHILTHVDEREETEPNET